MDLARPIIINLCTHVDVYLECKIKAVTSYPYSNQINTLKMKSGSDIMDVDIISQ